MTEGTFDLGWLRLREPVDHRSRARALVAGLRHEGRGRGWSRFLDLGAGTGSNLRHISSRVPWAKSWTVVDHDAALLEHVVAPGPRYSLRKVVGDLADAGLDAVAGHHIVTASALLDLVSDSWLGALVDRCGEQKCAAYFALSYDGSVEWSDHDPDDAFIVEAVNEHQRSDKGLGSALGPSATDAAVRRFEAAGYRTTVLPSPWLLAAPGDLALAELLVAGWAGAATELRPDEGERIRDWEGRRRSTLREGRTRVRVGHLDVLALPPDSG